MKLAHSIRMLFSKLARIDYNKFSKRRVSFGLDLFFVEIITFEID